MYRRGFMLGIAGAAVAMALPETAEAAVWVPLGTRRVNGLIDVDRINVGAGLGTFKRIRLKVRGNALLLYDLRVRYGNGSDGKIPVRVLIPQGGYTRSIDLAGNNRFIRYVQFTYGKLPNGAGPTFVELYGRR